MEQIYEITFTWTITEDHYNRLTEDQYNALVGKAAESLRLDREDCEAAGITVTTT